jgi:hypothetical protein
MQFTYQGGKSTVSSLHHLVSTIKNALRYKEGALTAFIDVEVAFNNTDIPRTSRMDHQDA